jgi:hypothetical protein
MHVSETEKPTAGSSVVGLHGFTHSYSAVNGTQIHYVIGGSGPALGLLTSAILPARIRKHG